MLFLQLNALARHIEAEVLRRLKNEADGAAAPNVSCLGAILRFVYENDGHAEGHPPFGHLTEELQKDFAAISFQVKAFRVQQSHLLEGCTSLMYFQMT